MKNLIKALLLLTVCIPFGTMALEDTELEITELEITEQQDSNKNANADEGKPVEEPSPATLKDKKLGDTFSRFTPTELIGADNAVSFPVDI